MPDDVETMYGLPSEVRFCARCVMSNQRPSSSIEFRHTVDRQVATLHIADDGLCDACRFAEQKERIDWDERERELVQLLDRYRREDGAYDCLVPGSGGKDSCFAAHILKYKYGMHPLTVTWPPILYTDVGLLNFRNWVEVGGFDNVTFKPNGRVHRLLTKLSVENLLHPFQTFILGQKNLAPKMALQFDIPLVFYGENEAEYGNPIADNEISLRSRSYYAMSHLDELTLGGVPAPRLLDEYGLSLVDLQPYLPAPFEQLERSNIEVHYLGYYLKWTPQEAYYYSVENCGFQANPFRTEGTYSKYNSLDDRIDGFHYYTTFIKFGLGRASYDASQEIRNRHLTREEGVALVRRFDGEFPERYLPLHGPVRLIPPSAPLGEARRSVAAPPTGVLTRRRDECPREFEVHGTVDVDGSFGRHRNDHGVVADES
jgi:N-acetyl sugar amidotransferase